MIFYKTSLEKIPKIHFVHLEYFSFFILTKFDIKSYSNLCIIKFFIFFHNEISIFHNDNKFVQFILEKVRNKYPNNTLKIEIYSQKKSENHSNFLSYCFYNF